MMKKKRIKSEDSLQQVISHLRPEDFDGHTDFQLLSPDQKLMWLSQAVQFFFENKGKASPDLHNR